MGQLLGQLGHLTRPPMSRVAESMEKHDLHKIAPQSQVSRADSIVAALREVATHSGRRVWRRDHDRILLVDGHGAGRKTTRREEGEQQERELQQIAE